jgi:hypothetical protein
MAAKIDNTATAIQKGAPLPPTRNKIGRFESFALTTSADGDACPPKTAASPSVSMKLEIMGTLFTGTSSGPAERQRCNIDVTSALSPLHRPAQESVFLVDTHVEIENGFSPSESMTSPKLSRYTLDMFWKRVLSDKNSRTNGPSLWTGGAEGIMGA